MMMDVVIYGMIFIVKMEKFFKVLLLNVFRIFKVFNWFCVFSMFLFVNGMGINVLILNMINIVKVNNILCFILVMCIKLEIVWNIRLF